MQFHELTVMYLSAESIQEKETDVVVSSDTSYFYNFVFLVLIHHSDGQEFYTVIHVPKVKGYRHNFSVRCRRREITQTARRLPLEINLGYSGHGPLHQANLTR